MITSTAVGFAEAPPVETASVRPGETAAAGGRCVMAAEFAYNATIGTATPGIVRSWNRASTRLFGSAGDSSRGRWRRGKVTAVSAGFDAQSTAPAPPVAESAADKRASSMTCQFQDLLVAEMPRLRNYAIRLCRNASLADDLLQQTALQAWRARAQFSMGTNFNAWLYRILRNEFLTNCRRAKRDPLVVDEIWETTRGYDSKQEDEVMVQQVKDAMDGLPRSQRDVLYLKYVGDYSYDEVAAALECSVGTIKSRLWRARNALQDIFREPGVPLPGNAEQIRRRAPSAQAPRRSNPGTCQ